MCIHIYIYVYVYVYVCVYIYIYTKARDYEGHDNAAGSAAGGRAFERCSPGGCIPGHV